MKKEVFRNNFRYLVWSGGSWAVFDSLTVAFLTVFAIALGASNTIIGVLSALTYVATLVVELPGAKLLDFFSKKNLVAFTGIIGRLGWVAMAFVPFIIENNQLLWVILIFVFIRFVELLGEPAWVALVADIVPEKMRGVVFGKRNMLIGVTGLFASIIGGVYLDLFPKDSYVGFSSLFVVGMIWAFLTWYCIMQIKEPVDCDHGHHNFSDAFSFSPVMWRFSVVCAVYYFAVMIASPFFTVYMLKNLNMNYTWFVVAGGIATLARVFSQYLFGRVVDAVGDHRVALFCMLGTALVPFSYIFITSSTWFLIIPAQIFSGIVWAGVDLATFNLLLDYTDKNRRAAQSAAFNMILSVSNIVGPVVGGRIADTTVIWTMSGIPLIFLIASLLRFCTSFLLMSLPEVRVKRHYSFGLVVRQILSFHPSKGFETRISSTSKHQKNFEK